MGRHVLKLSLFLGCTPRLPFAANRAYAQKTEKIRLRLKGYQSKKPLPPIGTNRGPYGGGTQRSIGGLVLSSLTPVAADTKNQLTNQ